MLVSLADANIRCADSLGLGCGLLCAIEGRRAARGGAGACRSGGQEDGFRGGRAISPTFIRDRNIFFRNVHFAKSALAQFTPTDFYRLVNSTASPSRKDAGAIILRPVGGGHYAHAGGGMPGGGGVDFSGDAGWRGFADDGVRGADRRRSARRRWWWLPGAFDSEDGATGFGYELARSWVEDSRDAGVVPWCWTRRIRQYCDLTGVSAEVVVATDSEPRTASLRSRQEFREKMLITHRGLSGPAILQISSYWSAGQAISIDLAPGRDLAAALRTGPARNMAAARAAFREFLPSRLAARWLELNEPASWTNAALAELERAAHAWVVAPTGTEGYEKAEVTAGGVDTDELSSKTMESRSVPGLFFIGEVVDVTGHLGGHNFQWAWASWAAAGRAV